MGKISELEELALLQGRSMVRLVDLASKGEGRQVVGECGTTSIRPSYQIISDWERSEHTVLKQC